MKRIFALSAAALLFGIGAIGCQKTAEGAKEDTATNVTAAKETADKAAVETKAAADKAAMATKEVADRAASATEKAAKNADEAVSLTPKVKMAIINDKELNNTGNLINVESGNSMVELKGYVLTKQMKARAENIARKVIKEAGSNEMVVDSLKVKSQ